MRKLHMAIASCAAVVAAGMAAALPLYGPADAGSAVAEAGPYALVLGGVATVVHQDADGNVIGEQEVHNQLLDAGEDFILSQVFMNGESEPDSGQIGAICLSAAAYPDPITESTTSEAFDTAHENLAGTTVNAFQGTSTILHTQTRECLTDTNVSNSTQVATVGPLIFTANNTVDSANWKPGVTIEAIGICKGFSATSENGCTAPLFAVVDINAVTLAVDETLTVTYTFDMSSSAS